MLELLLSSGNSFLYQTTEATLSPLYGTIHWGSSQTHWTSSITDGTIIFRQRNRYIRDAFTAFNDFASKTSVYLYNAFLLLHYDIPYNIISDRPAYFTVKEL